MAKLVLVVVLALVVVWLLRGVRRVRPPERPPEAPKPLAEHEEMVACTQCGVHLPRSEALPGRGGVFCSEAHRAAHEQAHDQTNMPR